MIRNTLYEGDVVEDAAGLLWLVRNDGLKRRSDWLPIEKASEMRVVYSEPYIRVIVSAPSELITKLRRIDPFEFERVCARILGGLGATARTTQRTNDGGADFIGVNMNAVPAALSVPATCKAVVIGQAKRYRDGNLIVETKLREFVGAGILERHQLLKEGRISPLTPVLFAFWTTSSFDPNAKRYARDMGLWYMDGVTLAGYVNLLGLHEIVLALPDAPA